MQRNDGKNSIASWARGCAVLCAALALAIGFGARPAKAAPFAYVTNRFSGTVSMINTATNMVVATFPAGGAPTYVAVSPDGNHLYVTNEGPNTVSVIDTTSNPPAVVATVPVGTFGPSGVVVAPDGTHVYVVITAGGFGNSVKVIDTATNKVVGSPIPVRSEASEIAISPDGTHAYVTNTGDGTVSVIDTATNMVVATVTVGTSPAGVAVTPDGAHVYVVNFGDGTVSVIDTATNKVVGSPIPVGPTPAAIAITPDGQHAYVTNVNNGSAADVAVIATSTNTLATTVPLAGPSVILAGVAVPPDGTHVYVVNGSDDTVSVIDTATNTVVATVPVGEKPTGVAIIPPPQCVPFSALGAKLAIYLDQNPNNGAFGLLSSFTLGSTSDGIDPVTEPVTLQIGSFNVTIPPGSFARSPLGTYSFIGTINGVNMEVVIQPTGGKQFAVEAAALNANLAGTANPVTVRLSIGDDCGAAPVNALIF